MSCSSTFHGQPEPGHRGVATRPAGARRTLSIVLVLFVTAWLSGCGGGGGNGMPTGSAAPPASTGASGTSGSTASSGTVSRAVTSSAGAVVSLQQTETLTGREIEARYLQEMTNLLGNGAGTVQANDAHVQFMEKLSAHSDDQLATYRLAYKSRDAKQQEIDVTGRIFVPFPKQGKPLLVPIVLYPHGTELKRDAVPSNSAGAEALVGCAAAISCGFVVAMPDLPGMGGADPKAYHPYCHADSLAYSVADMLVATRKMLESQSQFYQWNGEVYVVGYSEGGYAAMAAVRELEAHPQRYAPFTLRGEACMAAPSSLSNVMRKMMLDPQREFPAPFFLPYILFGYDAVYPGSFFDPSLSMNKTLLQGGADGNLREWMNGSIKGADADLKIESRMGVGHGKVIPRNLMDPVFVNTQLADPAFATSEVGKTLRANDLDTGWAPATSRMLILHAYDDDCVPFANSESAYDNFVKLGARERVSFLPIGQRGDKKTHVQAAMIALPVAFAWISAGMPMK